MNPVIVVEGRDDTRRLREIYPDIETIETNGSAIDEETIALIQKALQTREVIVFTDPDYPGTRIRNIIQERVPGVKHAFIEREEAVRKDNHKSLGVEHASTASIQRALESVHEISTEPGRPGRTSDFAGNPDGAWVCRTTRFSNKTSSGGGFSKNWPYEWKTVREKITIIWYYRRTIKGGTRGCLRK